MSDSLASGLTGEQVSRALAGFVDAVPVALAVSMPDGRIVDVNRAVLDAFGYRSKAEFTRKGALAHWLDPDDRRAFVELVATGAARGYEARFKRRDGSVFWGSVTTVGWPIGSESSLVTCFIDITAQKMAQEELEQQEKYFRALIENSLDVILVVDRDLKVRYESPSMIRVTGYRQDERHGKSAIDLVHPDDMGVVREAIVRLREGIGDRVSFETRLRHKSGQWRHVEVTAIDLLNEPAVSGIVASFRDITDRLEALDAVRRSEEYHRALIEKAEDGIVVLNPDGTIRYQSPHLERAMGYEQGERIGRNPLEFVDAEDIGRLAAMLQGLMQEPGAVLRGIAVRMHHRDGSRRTFEADATNLLDNPAVAGVVVNCRDVTRRTQAEEALRENEDKYRSLVERANDGITLVQDGIVKYTNPRSLEMVGYAPEEMIGRPIRDFLHPDEVPVMIERFRRVMSGEPMAPVYETILVHRDGHPVNVEMSGGVVTYQGRPADLVVARDITERKAAEQALRESEEKYRQVVERANDGITIIQDAILRYANPRSLEILGYTPDEIIGTPMSKHIHPDELPKVIERYQRRMGGEEVESTYETALIDKQGGRVEVELNAGVVTYEGRSADLVLVRDITERKRTIEALRESEEKFRLLVEEMNDGYCLIQDSRILFHNARSARMFGYSADELTGRSIRELLPPKILSELSKVHARRLKGEDVPAQYETVVRRKDGRFCPVELGTRIIDYRGRPAVSVVIRDITERRLAADALQRSEEKLRSYLESSPDAIYTMDLRGRFLYGNRAAERLAGYSKEELLGKTFVEVNLLPEEYIEPTRALLARNAEGRPTGPSEGQLIRKDGKRVVVEVRTYPIGKGVNVEIIGVARDITERKRAEEERQRMEEQLQLAGRLAAVGELAAGVAHELNNPLAAVQGYAQLLASREALDEQIRADVGIIYDQAQRASRITANLLSFARRHRPEKSSVSINEVVERSLELHEYRMRVNNIEVVTKLDTKLPETLADFHQMQQVFVNVITNAEQAMTAARGRGRLTAKTQRVGDMIRVSFTDNGPGIPEDNISRVFDPFFTTKEVGKGTGLGLSICYGIVREHGGRLYAKSSTRRGSTFVVEIPIVDNQTDHQQARAETAPPAGERRRKSRRSYHHS